MKKWKISLCAAPVLTAALAGAAVQNLLKRRERKPKRLPPLWTDPIRHLAPADVGAFVEEEIFPRSAEIVSALDENDRRSASLLLSSLTGFLVEAAPDDEKNLSTLLEMLDYCRSNIHGDAVGNMMRAYMKREDSEGRSVEPHYMNYLRFYLLCKSQRRVIESCRVMLYDLAASLHIDPDDFHTAPPYFDDEFDEFDDLLGMPDDYGLCGSDEAEETSGCG